MRVALFILSIVCAMGPARAQDRSVIDSLLALVDTTRHDTTQLGVYTELTNYFLRKPECSIWVDRAMALSEELSGSKDTVVSRTAGVYRSLNQCTAGLLRWYAGDINSALRLFTQSAAYLELQRDTLLHATLMNNIGMLYEDIADSKSALRYYKRSIEESRAVGDEASADHTTLLIADLLLDADEPDSAWKYAERAHRSSDSVLVWNVDQVMAGIRERQGRLEAARTLFAESMRGIERSGGNVNWPITLAYLRKAPFHLRQQEPDSALAEAERCVAAAEDQGLKHHLCRCAFMEGSIRMNLGDLNGARVALERGLAVAKELGITGRKSDEFNVVTGSALLSEVYAAQGDLRKALDMAAYHRLMRDSSDRIGDRRSLDLLAIGEQQMADSMAFVRKSEQARFEFQRQMDRERQRRNLVILVGTGLLVFGSVVLRQRNRIRVAHARSEELLLNILPEEVADELKHKGHADAKHFDNVTILFTDFKGFTQLSEQVTPAELVAELNTCFKAFDGIMGKYRIEKIKTIGDAYMAAGGLPDPQHGSPADVVRAALEMQDFMKRHKAEREVAGKPFFEMRVGIHSGPVVAGIVGVKKFQYDIWGDTVNTASRMESSGEVGQVNISEATYALVKDEPGLTFIPRGKVQAKGKGELEMYFVHRAQGA